MGFSGVISTTSPKSSAYDVSARGFFIAQSDAGVTLTDTQKNATNQLVIDLKAAGLWNKMKAVYPMVGGTATSHKFNLITPADTDAAFRLNFIGGWTHSSNGALPNGTNAYARTEFSAYSQNSQSLSYYSRTDSNIGPDMGNGVTGSTGIISLYVKETGASFLRLNTTAAESTIANTNGTGFYQINRILSTKQTYFKNTTKTDFTVNSTGVPSGSLYLGGALVGSVTYYGSKECAFASIGDGLTDLEAQLFYQITEKYQVALGRNVNATQSFYYNAAYNNETNAFLFSTQITDNTIQTATNTLVNDLKTANIWTKMKAVYPMVGGTATTHKFNLVNAQDTDAAFRLQFFGGGTHSANGYLPNGSNAYANTFCATNNMGLNSIHLSYYSRTNLGSNGTAQIGSVYTSAAPNSTSQMLIKDAYIRLNQTGTITSVTNTITLGLHIATRTASNLLKLNKNGSTIGTWTNASAATSTIPLYIAANNQNNTTINSYTSAECAFASIGDGLTDAEALSFFNAVNAFQISLARNV